jgi:hypothetical protein
MNEPQLYAIRIEGHLGSSWSSWFEGMTIRHEKSGDTQSYLARWRIKPLCTVSWPRSATWGCHWFP